MEVDKFNIIVDHISINGARLRTVSERKLSSTKILLTGVFVYVGESIRRFNFYNFR